MKLNRFEQIAASFAKLRIGIVGDFCLDRYLEIDPALDEVSIETGLPVHNVTRVRAQPGAAGTVLNNLVALGIGRIDLVGFSGEDGEGYELHRALSSLPGVCLDHFVSTPHRRTFTYCKPLVMDPSGIPRELNRLDSKNWTPTPAAVVDKLVASIVALAESVDALVVMDQVDVPDTGVVSGGVLDTLGTISHVPIIADSRRGLRGYPPLLFKMNVNELATLLDRPEMQEIDQVQDAASELARANQREVIVTLAERGIVGAHRDGGCAHVAAPPTRGSIDIVGAGDAVTANLVAAIAAQATLPESLEISAAAASVVIHQLGTTGTANVEQIRESLAETGM